MNKEILIEYVDMKEEIKDLRRRIDEDVKAINKLEDTVVSDSVTCGKKGKKPLRTVKIQGMPVTAINRKILAHRRKVAMLAELEADLLEKQTEVEEYIEGIKRSELRIMFRFYYIDDLTWYQVAMKMNQMFPNRRIKYTDDNCKQKSKRFFDKLI